MEGLLLSCGLKPRRVGQFGSVRASLIFFLPPKGWVIRVHMTPNLKGHEFKVPDYSCTENTQLFSPKSQLMVFLPIFPDLPLTGSDSKRTALLWGKPTMYLRKFSYLIIWGVFYQSARKMSALQGIKMCALTSFLLCLLLHQEMGAAIRSEQFSSCHSHQKFNRLNPDLSSDQAVPELSDTLKISCTGAEFKNVFCGVTSHSDRASGAKSIQRGKLTHQNKPCCFILCISQQQIWDKATRRIVCHHCNSPQAPKMPPCSPLMHWIPNQPQFDSLQISLTSQPLCLRHFVSIWWWWN